MSESATFSQPTTATTGLQRYDLEPKPKEVYPAPMPGRITRLRHAAWHKRFVSRGRKKGLTTMTKNTIELEPMVDMLRKSVTSIVAAAPANQEELLAKSFSEFHAAAKETIEAELAKSVTPAVEEPLFKGFGTVGRVANLVGSLAGQIATIKRGYEQWNVDKDGNPPADADPASPELVEHLEDLLLHAEMLMRVAVNDQCEPMDDGEMAESGMHVVMVPITGGGQMAVKTHLPEGLAKYATDPNDIDNILIDQGMNMLALGGVDTEALGKAMQGGELAKDITGGGAAAPMPMSSADAASQAGAGLPDDGQPENPLDVIGRLAALIMVQVDYVQQMMDGTNEPTDPTGEADPGAGGGSESNPSVSDAEAAAKAVTTGNLAKVDTASEEVLQKVLKEHGLDLGALKKMADDNLALTTKLNEFEQLVPELLAKAEPPKAPLISTSVSKENEDAALLNAAPVVEPDLSKMSPQSRAMELMKRQHRTAGRPSNGIE
jgi:hypothetical protein